MTWIRVKCQEMSLSQVKLNNEYEIGEHTAAVPSMLRNRSILPRSDFREKLVFSRQELPDSLLSHLLFH